MLIVDAIAPGSGDEDVASSGEDGGDWDQEPGSGAAQELEAVEWSQWSSCSPSCSQTRVSRCLDTPGTMMDCIQVPGPACWQSCATTLRLSRLQCCRIFQNGGERRERRSCSTGPCRAAPRTIHIHQGDIDRQGIARSYICNIIIISL